MATHPTYCPCSDETQDPCPACGATVKGNDAVHGVCQAIRLHPAPDAYGIQIILIDKKTGQPV